MKKILLVLSLISILLLSACGDSDQYNGVPRDGIRAISGYNFRILGEKSDDIAILEDRETGCKYLILGKDNYAVGMANYLDENGKPVGCKGVK